jgi:hypothetical protein
MISAKNLPSEKPINLPHTKVLIPTAGKERYVN